MNQKNNNISSFEYLSEAHFKFILEKVLEQVFGEKGKGYIRHGGKDTPLSAQTWKYISDQIGSPDFCIGQAIKKPFRIEGVNQILIRGILRFLELLFTQYLLQCIKNT
jgi:hypothetical protein